MSMDEQFAEMSRFRDALVHFNDTLRGNMKALKAQHDSIHPLWRDEMRKTYDQHWQPLDDYMQRYLEVDGPRYTQFLNSKLQLLRRYLYGN